MDVDSSTSSDSELEAKIKLKPLSKKFVKKQREIFSKQLCIICQESGQLVVSRETSKQRFIDCTKIRMNICRGNDALLAHLIPNFNNLKEQEYLSWHRNCYKTYTSSKNIDSYKSRYAKIVNNLSPQDARQKRSTRTQFDVKMCLFCQKCLRGQKLCQVMSKNMENKIKNIARENPKFYSRIGESDLIASEIKYHVTCVTLELRYIRKNKQECSASGKRELDMKNEALQQLFSEMKQGFQKGKGYTTTAVCQRYREMDGNVDISDRLLIKKVTKYFKDDIELVKSVRHNEPRMFVKKFSKQQAIDTIIHHTETEASTLRCGASELQILTKICQDIRNKIDEIPKNAEFANLKISDYRKHIPDDLYFIINLICNERSSKTKESEVLSICQDIIFVSSNRRKYTPKHIGLGLLVHQETRSKKLVEALHSCGHSISYTDTLRVRNSIAQEEIQLYLENDHSTIPRQLVPNRFVQFAADNIDILEDTLDKTPTFHGTQIAAFQRGPADGNVPRKLKFLPYNVKLNIPNDFHLLEKSQINKTQKVVPIEENRTIIIKKAEDLSYDVKYQNIAWCVCRMGDSEDEDIVIPQWSGFHKLIFEDKSHTTTYGYLPLLPHVSSEYDTVWTVITKCKNISKKLNNTFTVLTFDQAIYYKAKELQWQKPDETKYVIFRLGAFHITMNFLKVIGQFMENSGLADVWIESGLYGQSTVDGILAGKKYNKAMRAHKLTYESLMRILIPLFHKWLVECKSPAVHSSNLMQLYISEIRNHMRRKKNALPNFYKVSSLAKELFKEFQEFMEPQTATFKYWCTYLELVEILLEFQFAERTGNWELHLNSFRKMLPLFFVFDHTNYARWGTVYLLDMYKLPNSAPEVHKEFVNGNFVVKRLDGNFNQLSVDQALEHINKNSKDAGGIVGLTRNSTKLDEWYLSYNFVGMILDDFCSSLNVNNSSTQNVECGKKRMKVDEDSVLKLQSEFFRFNVFSKAEDRLLVISTNEIAPENVQTALLTVQKTGEEALRKFIDVVGTLDFYRPLRKNNLKTLKRTGVKLAVIEKGKIAQKGGVFLQKILAAKEMGRNIKYADIFKHELTTYPMSLAPSGIISIPTNKSALGNILENFTTSYKDLPISSHKTCHLFDGMALIHGLGKPVNAESFGDYVNILASIVFRNKYNAGRIDFVLDNYKDCSIKNRTREQRGLRETIERAIESTNTLLPEQWHLFIHSAANKRRLTNFVSNQLYERSIYLGVKFVTSGGFHDVLECKANYDLSHDLLAATHEEADTRIILHILAAKMEGYTRCIVDCKDTDVLVILAYFKDTLTPEIWMKVGTKESERFIAIHELKMESSMIKCLPAFHALTGCDTTSQFVGLGKRTCWKVFLTHYNLLDKVGIEQHLDDEVFNDIVKFVVRLYTTNESIKCINTLRGILASSKPISKLPPTKDSLKQHCRRVHYQTKVWLNSTVPKPSLPDVSDCGWSIVNGKLVPVLTTEPVLPEDTSVLNTCNCKKDCTASLCSCKRKGIACIGSCKCMAQSSCANKVDRNVYTISTSQNEFDSEVNSDSD